MQTKTFDDNLKDLARGLAADLVAGSWSASDPAAAVLLAMRVAADVAAQEGLPPDALFNECVSAGRARADEMRSTRKHH